MTDDHRMGSPRRASTRACTSRARIGSRSSASTSEIASMIRPRRGWAVPGVHPGSSVAQVRRNSIRASASRYGRSSKASSRAGGLEWCPLRPMRCRRDNDPPANGHVLMSGRSAPIRRATGSGATVRGARRLGPAAAVALIAKQQPAAGQRDCCSSSIAVVRFAIARTLAVPAKPQSRARGILAG